METFDNALSMLLDNLEELLFELRARAVATCGQTRENDRPPKTKTREEAARSGSEVLDALEIALLRLESAEELYKQWLQDAGRFVVGQDREEHGGRTPAEPAEPPELGPPGPEHFSSTHADASTRGTPRSSPTASSKWTSSWKQAKSSKTRRKARSVQSGGTSLPGSASSQTPPAPTTPSTEPPASPDAGSGYSFHRRG